MYVPVNIEKYVDWAHTRGADVIQLDLEDSVPTAGEVEYARKVIELDQAAASSGRGSFALDGKMIDISIIVRAQKPIRRYESIKRRESWTLAALGKS